MNPVSGLKREVAGVADTRIVDRTAIRGVVSDGRGAAVDPCAMHKPEFQAKVKALDDQQSKTDPVFYCARPGLPRVGPPRRIIQMPNEMIFLYEDMSGDPYRIIPTDGRAPAQTQIRRYYGDAVGRWKGRRSSSTSGTSSRIRGLARRAIHTDAMRSPERLWRAGESRVAGYRGRPQRPHGSMDDGAAHDQAFDAAARRVARLP